MRLGILALVLGLAANTVLFFAFFRCSPPRNAPARSLWSGALLGALGFEVLKQLSTYLLAGTKDQPAVQAFGIALILVVWINYFSRVVVLRRRVGAHVDAARAQRERDAVAGRRRSRDRRSTSSRPPRHSRRSCPGPRDQGRLRGRRGA